MERSHQESEMLFGAKRTKLQDPRKMLSSPQMPCEREDRSYFRKVAKQPRQRFTPWLQDQIEKKDIEGLEWIDKERGIFKVPWVRVDKPEFEPAHAELFKRWAQHTGKYRRGDQADPSTWKTRFRCALRKMQEIKEIRELGKLEGSNPYRAFKFEPKPKDGTLNSTPRPGRRPAGKTLSRRRSSSSSDSTSSTETGGTGEALSQAYAAQDFYPYYCPPMDWDINEVICQMFMPNCPADWDMSIYFPESIQSQFGFSTDRGSSIYTGQRNQELNYHDLQPRAWDSYPAQDGYDASSMYSEVLPFRYSQMMRE